MKTKYIIPIALLCLLIAGSASASARTITVGHTTDADYWTIQEAVDAAAIYGDTIQVMIGTYNENIVISKSLILRGDDKSRTIIDGGGSGIVVNVTANNVTIRGFTIQNGKTGIKISSRNNAVTDNIIKDIKGTNCDDRCTGGSAYGIYLLSSTGTTISSNTISGVSGGDADYRSTGGSAYGIYLLSSTGTISSNTISGVSGGSAGSYGTGGSAYGIYLSSSTGTISSNTISGVSGGSVGYYGTGGSAYGIYLSSSTGTTISRNTISSISGPGTDRNIYLHSSTNNTITNNTLSASDYGFYLTSASTRNIIYHNNIMNSTHNGYDDSGSNGWDNGQTSGGNYWSDYSGVDTDGDGVGDTPYDISGGTSAQDNYPFMEKDGWTMDINITPPSTDSDGDGIADSDDLCLGFDDTYDFNGNGIPDCVECGSSTNPPPVTINLHEGWNLIGWTAEDTDDVEGAFSGLDWVGVGTYENGIWKSYVPGYGGSLSSIQLGHGYFINMSDSGTLTMEW